ncbi:armadillo-type protein [Umbelopsis sp. PMI_123]|nr:armadillo-type protein [Umbelopsis sp. PMI_123]
MDPVRRKELAKANQEAWSRGKADASKFRSLDSNIKKNTAFIKKCKTSLQADYQTQLMNDINKLSLEKYISEIVGAVIEGMAKCRTSSDVTSCVEVISALHQRFPDSFTLLFTYQLAKVLAPPTKQQLASLTPEQREKEDTSRALRQRTYLRLASELWLVNVLRNVSDGVATPAAVNLEGMETQRDNVAGLVGSTSSIKEKSKETKETDQDAQSGHGFVYSVLRDLFANDKTQHSNLLLAASFMKNYGSEIIGITPRKQRAAVDQALNEALSGDGKSIPTSGEAAESQVNVATREAFKTLMMDYHKSLEKHLVKEHKYIKRMDQRNHEILFSRGQLNEETKQNYEKLTKAYEKLLANTQTMADALDVEMPELPDDDGTTKMSIISSNGTNTFADDKDTVENGIWEDEDARSFYEKLADLKVLVPGVLLESAIKKDSVKDGKTVNDDAADVDTEVKSVDTSNRAAETEGEKEDELLEKLEHLDLNDMDNDEADAEPESEVVDVEQDNEANVAAGAVDTLADKDDAEDAANGGTGIKSTQMVQLEALLARLPTLNNRDMIDSVAVEFCYLNSKSARKRLIKTLLSVPRTRVDLLPYYARLIATLNPYYPDIGDTILAALEHEFKGLFRKKSADLLETRVKNIRYLAELTKFRITPSHTIFHIFKIALDDFTNQNIDIVCNLLETCGRFLLKSPETGVRMGNMLEIVMRKKNIQHLDNRYILMVENAYYQANPPDRSAIVKKERSPLERYIRKLVYGDLNKKTLEKILKQFRKLDWNDPKIVHIMNKCFQKIWKIKYSNIHLISILASGLNRYHSDFGVQLVDSIIEEIRVGLEMNIFKHNQRRIATVKYLGELYNYRMVESTLIFDTLYTIVTLGHDLGRPSRERFCPIDAPDDFFRVRLCCTLLDTCGMCFDRGSTKKKLDSFLIFFQMYRLSKSKPPMDVEFMVMDTLELLRPNLKLATSYEDANEAVDQMLLEQLKTVQGGDTKLQEDGFEDSGPSSSSSDEGDDDDVIEDKEDEIGDMSDEESLTGPAVDEDEDVVMLKKREEQVEEDEEFEKEFSKMMSESVESRKFEKKSAMLDVPIPMHLRGGQDRRTFAASNDQSDGNMSFTLLTKKGNRQQVKLMEVPSDSLLAINTRSKQEAEREEQQQLKQIVLNYEEREEANARTAAAEDRKQQRFAQRPRRIFHMGGGGGDVYSSDRGRR